MHVCPRTNNNTLSKKKKKRWYFCMIIIMIPIYNTLVTTNLLNIDCIYN